MAIFDIFKKKKKEVKKEEKKAEKKIEQVKEEKVVKEKPAVSAKEKKVSTSAYRIINIPYTVEKASELAQKNQYVFKVFPRANKIEIKKAIEESFGVDVLGVKIINLPGKKRRTGKTEGFKAGYKKAIVRIKEGQKIEVLSK